MATREIYKESDGRFTVRVWIEPNQHGNDRIRVRFGYRGGEVRTDTAKTEKEALIKAAQLWQSHVDGLLDAPAEAPDTIGQLRDLFVKRTDIAAATKETYTRQLKRFVDFVGEDRDLQHVGKGAVAKWFAQMTCKPVSQASYLRSLSAMFKWAMLKKFVDVDPTTEVEIEKFKTTIRPWMQYHEWAPFLDACRGVRTRQPDGTIHEAVSGHRLRAEFVLHTGLRAGELAEARWSWLHGTVGMPAITVPASKSRHPRAIPLDDRVQEVLQECKIHWPPDANGDGLIFGQMDPHNLRRDNVKACTKAEVTVTDFHGLRRSCGARWLELGIPLLHVSRMLGHADVSTTARHYAGLADGTLATEIAKVNAAAAAVKGKVIPIRPRAGQ